MVSFYSLEQFAEIINGTILLNGNSVLINIVNTDSRKLDLTSNTIFFAIKGKFHNANKLIKEIYGQGIRHFVVEKGKFDYNDTGSMSDANIIEVKNSISALQALATNVRNQFDNPVLAITGSNGKTYVKEWLASSLSSKYNVCKSPKSYNSQIGVPLSVIQLGPQYDYAVFEAGISQKDEMQNLANIIQPSLGLFTNIGTAHAENFNLESEKIEEKIKLFKTCDKIYYCSDYIKIDNLLKKTFKGDQLIDWSTKNGNAKFFVKIEYYDKATVLYINDKKFDLKLKSKAFIENVIHCLVFLLSEFDYEFAKKAIRFFNPLPMRMTLKRGNNNCYLIDDTYNNDFIGFKAALEYLLEKDFNFRKTVILSDFVESAVNKKLLYEAVAKLLPKKIYKFIGIGEDISNFKDLFKDFEAYFFKTTEGFLSSQLIYKFRKELILVKGSRKFNFEKIINRLEEKQHKTILEVNLDSITHNLNYFKSVLMPNTKILAMVKAFTYGSGNFEIPSLLEHNKVDYLGIVYADEGLRLRQYGIKLPILLLNPTEDTFEVMLENNLEPEIYSIGILKSMVTFLNGRKIKVHLKIDTGMSRLGILESDINEILQLLGNNKNITIQSIFSHLAASEDKNEDNFTKYQVDRFLDIYNQIAYKLKYEPIKHILNTSGILRFPHYQFDMVRIGIGLYGVGINKEFEDKLLPSNTLSSVITQIKYFPKGATIGYGRTGILEKGSYIGVISIGYADGFSRHFGNGRYSVYIKGKRAPIIGNICMDMCMIDLSNVPEAREGDKIIIFGKEQPIEEMARAGNTISYEILSQVNERVKRIYTMT